MRQNNCWLQQVSPSLIIYDLDGTLIDSLQDIASAVNQMRRLLKLSEYRETDIAMWIGKGQDHLLIQAMMDNPDLLDEGRYLYERIYSQINGRYSTVYPGVETFLQTAQSQNILQAVVTNKHQSFAEALLHKKTLHRYFTVIYGGDALPEKKPHPLPLLRVIRDCGVFPEQTVMIGDSIHDIRAAKSAAVRSVGLTCGYNHGQPVHLLSPDWTASCLNDLL